MRARRTLTGVAVQDAPGEKEPYQQVHADGRGHRRHFALPIEEAADVVERGRKADHRGRERHAEAPRLRGKLLPPVIVHAVNRSVGHLAGGEMFLDEAAHGKRQGERGHERGHEHAGHDGRRGEDTP